MVNVNVLMLVVNNIRLTGVGRCWIDLYASNTIAVPTYVMQYRIINVESNIWDTVESSSTVELFTEFSHVTIFLILPVRHPTIYNYITCSTTILAFANHSTPSPA